MPSLPELKSRWFIPTDGSSPDGVPCHRGPSGGNHPLAVSTDGNTVRPLIDGEEYMRAWREGLLELHGQAGAELYHAGWRFEPVETLGATARGSDALEEIAKAWRKGVSTYVLACRNLRCFRFNQAAVTRLRRQGIRTVCLDSRFPPRGSNHQKFSVMKSDAAASAIVGSVDIAKPRWDTSEHLVVNPNRDRKLGQQTHEVSVVVEGPAVADIEKTFRERWNDSTRTAGLAPFPSPRSPIDSPLAAPTARGPHSVQVLRTYGITAAALGYSWSPIGEFTIWASLLNAIKNASAYVYIEDQYFMPFDWPPSHSRTGLARNTDIVYQLGEAMKRGVDVIVLTSSTPTGLWQGNQMYHRDVAANYLQSIRREGSPGDVVLASLHSGGSDVYVHSKLMITDDEFVSVGSANVNRRSMAYDSELQIGVVDETGELAPELRAKLWAEHTGLSVPSLRDPDRAFDLFKASVASRRGHLEPYPVDPLATYPPTATSAPARLAHAAIVRRGLDPYSGPRWPR